MTTLTEDAQLARMVAIAEALGEGLTEWQVSQRVGCSVAIVHAASLAMRPEVQAAKQSAMEAARGRLEASAVEVAGSLVDLAVNAEDEGVRARAAGDVLDRIGVVAKAEPTRRLHLHASIGSLDASLGLVDVVGEDE